MIEKVFFQPGDLVTLKQDIPNKPIMIVVKKETRTFKLDTPMDGKNTVEYFRGINVDGLLQMESSKKQFGILKICRK